AQFGGPSMRNLLVFLLFSFVGASELAAAQVPPPAADAQKMADALAARAQRAALADKEIPGVRMIYGDDVLTGSSVCVVSAYRSIGFTSADGEDHVGLGYASNTPCEREGEIRLFLVLDAPGASPRQRQYRLWISGTRNDLLGVPSMHGESGGVERIQ